LAGLPDALETQIEAFAKGYDKQLLTQSMSSSPASITMGDPEKPFSVALQSFSAGIPIATTILIGNQTGERASTEDAHAWNLTGMSRRESFVIPQIELTIQRLMQIGVIETKEFVVDWDSLIEPTLGEKLDNGVKMADINQKSLATGEVPYSSNDIRDTTGFEAEEDDLVGETDPLDLPEPDATDA
jgi:hypothetical protein